MRVFVFKGVSFMIMQLVEYVKRVVLLELLDKSRWCITVRH